MKRFVLTGLAALVIASASQAQAAEPETYAFKLEIGNGTCSVKYPRADGMTLAFMTFPGDPKVIAGVVKDQWGVVKGKNLDDQTHPLTFSFQGASKTTGEIGGYMDAETQGFWTIWDTGGGKAKELLGLMKTGTVITVNADDGTTLGTFDLKQKGMVYTLLKSCMEQQNSKMPDE